MGKKDQEGVYKGQLIEHYQQGCSTESRATAGVSTSY